jgi:hypothetical protein
MPYAVIPRANPIVDATLGVTGALTGATQGMQYNEDVRQKKEAADTQRRQFADEMAFKLHNLKIMQSENLLTREQEVRLKKMDEDWGSSEHNLDRNLQQDITTKDRVEQGREHDEQQKTTRIGDIRQQQASNYATKTTGEAQQTGLAQSAQQNANQSRLTAVGQIRSTYGDPSTWAAKGVEKEAEDAYLHMLYSGGQLDGGKNAIQIPRATLVQDLATLHNLAPEENYKAEVTRNTTEQGKMAFEDAKGRAEGGNFSTQQKYANGTNPLNKRTVTNIVAKDSIPNLGTGLQPLDNSQFSQRTMSVINDIELKIHSDAAPVLYLPPAARDAREMMQKQTMNEVHLMIDDLEESEDKKQALKDRYDAGIMYATNVNIQEALQTDPVAAAGLVGEGGN